MANFKVCFPVKLIDMTWIFIRKSRTASYTKQSGGCSMCKIQYERLEKLPLNVIHISRTVSGKWTGLCRLLRIGIPHTAHLYNNTVICFAIWKNRGHNKCGFIPIYSDIMHELQNTLGTEHNCQIKEASIDSRVCYLHRSFTCKGKVMANFTVAEI